MTYFVWLFFGAFGDHRFLAGKQFTRSIFVVLTTLQIIIVLTAFSGIGTALWPYAIFPLLTLRWPAAVLCNLIGHYDTDIETQLVQPALLVLTAPIMIVGVWWLTDLFRMRRWNFELR